MPFNYICQNSLIVDFLLRSETVEIVLILLKYVLDPDVCLAMIM